VRAYSAPSTYVVPTTGSLTDDLLAGAAAHPRRVVAARRVPHDGGAWVDVTSTELLTRVRDLAKGLVAAGVQPGDRVALVSRTRFEWTLTDYAIWYAGAVTVPIYETSSPDQIAWILADSGCVLVVVETDVHHERVTTVSAQTPQLRRVVQIEGAGLDALVREGSGVSDTDVEARRAAVTPDSIATVIYTSGTTGRPKGCVLTHANFMFELGVATGVLEELFDTDGASTLLFLPLAHVFARVIQIGAIRQGAKLGHCAEVRTLLDDLAAFEPTFVLAVPRVFEKVFNTASQRAAADGRGKIFDAAAATAVTYSQAIDRSGPGPVLRARRAVFDRLVYRKLRAVLGGEVRYAVSGGAPLGERLAHFYRGIGVPVLEGYGLTETTAALTVNLPGHHRIGTVGQPIPGTGVRLADDGELLFAGGQVFGGYWHDDAATADAFEEFDGRSWLRTGDMGEIDDNGYVRITGRKKEILVTAGGKNVAPSVLEDRVRAHHLVSQCMVVGDGRPFVAALVTLDAGALEIWTETHSKQPPRRKGGLASLVAALVDDPDVLTEVQRAIDTANQAVSQAEAIRKFTVLSVDWAEDSGELTPTLKLKRAVVMRRFHHDIEALYV